MTNRATLYLRSSKDRSDVSIDAQRRALHELAGTRGLVVVDEFADAVESGKDDDRPGFQRLIASLKQPARAWEHVLVLDTSRIARRRLISMIFEKECEKRGVRLVYKSLPESDPATDMVLRSVLQAFDEYHSLISRAKGLAGMAENVRQGWRAGGKAPRGYKLEYHATGAVREGTPVTKSRLILDDDTSQLVQAYLRLRAAGTPRGTAIAKLQLPWPASSTHSMDWQALTYAGHTVWNMHAERRTGSAAANDEAADKRRPRSEWLITRNTHPPLISDEEAEALLRQLDRAVQGRRLRESPLLLTGLLVTAEGAAWHSDGCGYYRLGKGRKVSASRLEEAVLGRLAEDLASDEAVRVIRRSMEQLASGDPIDGRSLAGMERRITSLTTQIGRTVDLAAQLDDPAPVLRRVRDLEHQRAELVDELARLRNRQQQAGQAASITDHQVRGLLARLFAEISDRANDNARRAEARQALHEVLERIEFDPDLPTVRLHYAVATGDNLASPRGFEPL
ncbi:recombinase family protein [Methylibium sp.]|uniref:recombinase family protein n=1 Tax=Methylibium sp. TaxID=2067992 RepID=UPI003D1299A0